ncbi:MAG: acyltransferase domain-containing protein [bacterium]|nr:acyltransferase domain-containing protein [bacterium]
MPEEHPLDADEVLEEDPEEEALGEEIAIIGMAGRFPGAASLDEFWSNLRDGRESISFFSDEEVLAAGADPEILKDPRYVKARGVLEGVELFDASFFGLSPREAAITDPQHRLFLECTWEALEDAGYDVAQWGGRVGVYAGTTISTYLLFNLLSQGSAGALGDWQIGLLNEKDSLSTQVSYKLDLKGPSVTVQSACSTSLVSVHIARQSLLNYECDMALAGGVTIRIPQRKGYLYQSEGILSPDGHCRAFDAGARGVVFGSGAGVVALKRLEEALADGDSIHAVIKSSAVNNDGSLKVGFTAPSLDGQAEVIAKALAIAEVDPAGVSYVEAHGTGTDVGDSIEIGALTKAFRGATAAREFCAIGSVKTNIGHLDSAAGVAGLIKTVLMLRHRMIPPSLHFETPNPKLALETSPFYVNRELREWPGDGRPRLAGVSAFGIGGTNAHLVVEEAPARPASGPSRPWQLLILSAREEAPLEGATDRLIGHLRSHREHSLADTAYTLQVGRAAFPHRRMLVCRDVEDALGALDNRDRERLLSAVRESGKPATAFLFPGQGAQHVDMGRELYDEEAIFRDAVDRCAEFLKPHLDRDLRELLYPVEERAAEAAGLLDETRVTQPALFVIEYALARLWMAWGVRPQAMIGHSIGEYVAAHLAGVFSLEEALELVAARGRLMQRSPRGAMLAVELSEEDVRPLLHAELALAAVNAAARCVVSGTEEAVAQAEARLAAQGVESRRLPVSHAFHSPLMDGALEPFEREVGKIRLRPPELPFLSNLTGRWIEPTEATDPGYWVRHLRQTVRFDDGIALLYEEPDRVLLEVGPGRTLGSLGRRHPRRRPEQAVVSSLRHRRDQGSDLAALLTALGRLWLAGAEVDWPGFYGDEHRRRVALPTYPFARRRHWIEAQASPRAGAREPLRKRPEIADWFYLPSWKRSLSPPPLAVAELAATRRSWLLFVDDCGLGPAMADRLSESGRQVVRVFPGEELELDDEGRATLDPGCREHYEKLLEWLRARDEEPQVVVHLWSVSPHPGSVAERESFDRIERRGFDSLLLLTQAWTAAGSGAAIEIVAVSTDVQRVTGEEALCPAKATVLGVCEAAPRENPALRIRSIDLVLPEDERLRKELAAQLLSELAAPSTDPVLAYRGRDRWVPMVEPVRLGEELVGRRPLRERGVYLLTGGLGPVGFEIVKRLAGLVAVRLVFLEPAALPAREQWPQWLAAPAAADDEETEAIRERVRRVHELEQLGAEVLVLGVDLTDPEAMRAAVDQARERFGTIHGILHLAARMDGDAPRREGGLPTPQEIRNELARKMVGALVLDALFAEDELDFFVVFSALTAMPGLGRRARAAASSALLDRLAEDRARRGVGYAVAIDWGQNVGFRDFEEEWPTFLRALKRSGMAAGDAGQAGMSGDEAFDALSRILGSRSLARIIVSTQEIDALARLAAEAEPAEAAPRSELPAADAVPDSPLDRRIAAVWHELLGVAEVGMSDNFFDLGGDSLVAVQVVNRLRDFFPVELHAQVIFDHPTFADFGTAVEEVLTEKIEQLSEEEAQQLMESLYDERF